MSTVEERLTRLEQEVLALKQYKTEQAKENNWVFQLNDRFRGDEDLTKIYQLAREIRDQQRIEEAS